MSMISACVCGKREDCFEKTDCFLSDMGHHTDGGILSVGRTYLMADVRQRLGVLSAGSDCAAHFLGNDRRTVRMADSFRQRSHSHRACRAHRADPHRTPCVIPCGDDLGLLSLGQHVGRQSPASGAVMAVGEHAAGGSRRGFIGLYGGHLYCADEEMQEQRQAHGGLRRGVACSDAACGRLTVWCGEAYRQHELRNIPAGVFFWFELFRLIQTLLRKWNQDLSLTTYTNTN